MEGEPAGNLTPQRILDNNTLYWLTGTGASAARSYWEGAQAAADAAGHAPPQVSLPVGYTTFPARLQGAAQLGRKSVPQRTYFNEVDKGGHFAAWEEPELFGRAPAAFDRSASAAGSWWSCRSSPRSALCRGMPSSSYDPIERASRRKRCRLKNASELYDAAQL